MIPRGIRNNNPGNIRHGGPWQGLAPLQPDPNFCSFISPFYGIRALCRTLINYQLRHDKQTIAQILFRWAPPVENDTEAYICAVAKEVGIAADDPIKLVSNTPLLVKLAKAITKHENGECPFPDEDFFDAAIDASKVTL